MHPHDTSFSPPAFTSRRLKKLGFDNWTDYFWSRVAQKDEPNACWTWLGCCNSTGYGTFKCAGKIYTAHRFAWMLTYGLIPEGQQCNHSCDNPKCCNPSHLWLGTQAENVADRVAKGRNGCSKGDDHYLRKHPEKIRRGDQSHRASLTEYLVRDMKRRYRDGVSLAILARDYGVSYHHAWKIVHGESWEHIE